MLTFYNGADSLQSQIDSVVGKVLMQLSIIPENFKPWEGMK
jgi:4-hydroxy-3-polyprenylbenzoate decarboxylase